MIQLSTKSCRNTEEEHPATPGYQLHEEEKLDARKAHLHRERTKHSKGTKDNKWLELAGAHLRVGQDVSLCGFSGGWRWGAECRGLD